MPVIDRLAIVGIGLIGSSIARAAIAHDAAGSVTLYDASTSVRKRAGEIDLGEIADTLEDCVKDADLVILSNDLINCADESILNTKILSTIVNGELVYSSEEDQG